VKCLSLWTKELDGGSSLKLLAAGFGTIWSLRGYRLMSEAIRDFLPDVVHVHNIFPLFSPSIYYAASNAGVPVVQTIHNYRLACANALLLRNEKPCTDCVGGFPWPGLRHRCFGNSLPRTAAVTAMNVFHRWLGTFEKKIHAYIALTPFSKGIWERAGISGTRIFVKPNFHFDSGKPLTLRLPQIVYAGEISRAKGVHLLLQAWKDLGPTCHSLLLMGDGPDRGTLEHEYADSPRIVWLGAQPRAKVIEQIAMSRCLVLPSLAYENFSMSVLEALAAGTPVIVPEHGSFPSIVSNGREGFLFTPADVHSLLTALSVVIGASEQEWLLWSQNARSKYLAELTADLNYAQLMVIYQKAREYFEITVIHEREGKQAAPLSVDTEKL
jgi:glycosyltransferase involved in cell wall biosynthesis